MIFDEVVEPFLHLLGGLGEPLLVERVHQHDLVVDQRSADGRAAHTHIEFELLTSVADPDSLVIDTDPVPDPSIIKQNSKKNMDSYSFATSLSFIFEK